MSVGPVLWRRRIHRAGGVGLLLLGAISCNGDRSGSGGDSGNADNVFEDPVIDSTAPIAGGDTAISILEGSVPPVNPPVGGDAGGIGSGGAGTGSTGRTGGTGTTGGTGAPGIAPLPAGTAEVRFETSPAGASVVLRSGKMTYNGTTPFTVKVPAGNYAWTVSKDGFLRDSSGSAGLQLVAAPRTVSIALMNASDWSGIADKADTAFAAGNCEQAVPLYRSLDKPKERGSRTYERWAETRMKLGRCSQRLKDPAGAVEALKAARDDNPGGVNWRIVYELGIAQCSNLSFTEGRRTFGELDGQIRNRVSSENRPAMRALSYYGRAFCDYQDFESRTGTPPAALVAALDDDFERFFKSAEAAKEQGAMSADVNKLLNEAIADAEALRKQLPDKEAQSDLSPLP
jgi:hypothetical protein